MLRQDGGDVEIVDIKDNAGLLPSGGRLPGLRQRQPDAADAGRTNAEGHGR